MADAHDHQHNHPKVGSTPIKSGSTVAKSEDGTIQIVFTIPYDYVKQTEDEVLQEIAKDTEIPGFRKGNAPIGKVKEKLSPEDLIQHTLSHILPHALSDAVAEHKIRPAIYPKFELIKAKEGESWEIKATTCELPEVELGNYKDAIKSAPKPTDIWIPGKADPKTKPNLAEEKAKKEELVIKTLLEVIKIKIPAILLEEEVNARLSSLLSRIEKLGLNLDSYLASIGKTADALREDYKKQSEETLKLDLGLAKIIELDKIKIEEKQVEEAYKVSAADPNFDKNNEEEQKRIIRRILEKRAALDSLVSLL